jgi:hypothetical protein
VGEDRDGRGGRTPRRAEGGVREGEVGDLGEAGEVGEAGAADDGDVEGSYGREGLVIGRIWGGDGSTDLVLLNGPV